MHHWEETHWWLPAPQGQDRAMSQAPGFWKKRAHLWLFRSHTGCTWEAICGTRIQTIVPTDCKANLKPLYNLSDSWPKTTLNNDAHLNQQSSWLSIVSMALDVLSTASEFLAPKLPPKAKTQTTSALSFPLSLSLPLSPTLFLQLLLSYETSVKMPIHSPFPALMHSRLYH